MLKLIAVRHHFRSHRRMTTPFAVRTFVTPHKPLPSQKGDSFGAGNQPPEGIAKSEGWKSHHAVDDAEFEQPNIDTAHTNVSGMGGASISEEDPAGPRDDSTRTDRLENVVQDQAKRTK